MKAKKIYEHAKLHVDGTFPWVHALRWLNEAQELIATTCDSGGIDDVLTIITTEENKWHDLPTNKIEITKVIIKDVSIDNYKEKVSKIFLPYKGVYTIEYKRLPKELVNESDIPELHELYHLPMSLLVASREQSKYNPDNPDGQKLESSFYTEITLVDTRLKKNHRVRKIKSWW